MNYIQLSALPLPTALTRAAVFPFLQQDGHIYRFALLISRRNRLAQAFAATLGFAADTNLSIALPGGNANDLWMFFVLGDQGPIKPLDDQLPAANATSLAHYITFGTLTPLSTSADVLQPSSVVVHENKLQDLFQETTAFQLEGMKFKPPADWLGQLSATPESTDQVAVSLTWPIAGEVLATDFHFDLPVTLVPRADSNGTWGGATLQANGVDVVGGPQDRLPVGGGALVTTLNASNPQQCDLQFDWQPTGRIELPLLHSSLFKVGIDVQMLSVRFSVRTIGVFLLDSISDEPVRLRIDLEFPLIMAPLKDAPPEALALIIPLVAPGGASKLSWSLTFTIDLHQPQPDPPQPLVSYSDTAKWSIGNLPHWPMEFADSSPGLGLGGLQFSLADLLGDALGGVSFDLSPDGQFARSHPFLRPKFELDNNTPVVTVPMEFGVSIGDQRINLGLSFSVNLQTLRLHLSNRINLYFPVSSEGDPVQIIDLGAFAVLLQYRQTVVAQLTDVTASEVNSLNQGSLAGRLQTAFGVTVGAQVVVGVANSEWNITDGSRTYVAVGRANQTGDFTVTLYLTEPDGVIDFEKREFVLNGATSAAWVVVPGLLDIDDDPTRQRGRYDFTNRLIFSLDKNFDPDNYKPGEQSPAPTGNLSYFRINSNGVSFHAVVDPTHAVTVFAGDTLSRKIDVRPQKERKGRNSHIVLVDNAIREAAIFAEMDVPATDDLVAAIEMGLRQKKRGAPPVVYAAIDLDTKSEAAIAQLTAGYLQISIPHDGIKNWTLTWDTGTNDWQLALPTNLRISVAPRTSSVGGLDQLRDKDAITVRDLDLMNLHKGAGSIELHLDRDVEFDCLDGMFGVRLSQLSFTWGPTFVIECETADFTFKNPGAFDVTIEVGGVHLEFSGGSKLKMATPSRIGIDATIGDSVRFRGEVAWVDNDHERFFAAGGTLTIQGLPEATTLMKIGTGVKDNGEIAPNIVLYGAADYEITLFAGVVAKSFGAGIGVNNRLKGIGEHPNAEEVLANIDSIDPSRIDGWEFVTRNGFFLSIVGTTTISSTEGGNDVNNAYVAALVLSIDVDLNVVAAGKLWLYSSVDFVRRSDNWNRPALVGAIVMVPRERLITAAFESKPNPAVESNDQVADILNKGHVKLSFLMSPDLVDFFLQDVSYQDQFLGVDMQYRGSLRFAIFRGVVLLRASQTITGHFKRRLPEGPGGFSADGDVAVSVEFGGLISGNGLTAYGMIAISIALDVEAWIAIEFSFTIGCGRFKKRISFSKTFNMPPGRLELGLSGAVAFDESGQFGFDGRMSISVSICGYRLSIAPSLRFNEGLIADVRGRVAAFEDRIEAYRQQLLNGNQRGTHEAPLELTEAVVVEEWLFYASGQYLFMLPRSKTDWYVPHVQSGTADVPPKFDGDVRTIRIYRDQGQGRVRVLELLTPWDLGNQKKLAPADRKTQEDSLAEVEAVMAETAASDDRPAKTPRNPEDFRQVSDPRYRSSGREYWTDEDQIRLPDYAFPIQLRPIDDLLASTGSAGSESDIPAIVDYQVCRQRAVRIFRQQGNDRDDSDQIAHNRGAFGQLLLDQAGSVAPDSAWIAQWTPQPAPDINPDTRFGVVFQLDSFSQDHDFGQLSFEVTRNMSGTNQTSTIQVTAPTSSREIDLAAGLIHTFPPRQQFVIDQAGVDNTTQGETGRVIVKLPMYFDDDFLKTRLETFSHLRIWRQLPWQEKPEMVGDQVRPELVYLDQDTDPAVVVGPFVFTDQFPVKDRQLSTPGMRAEATTVEYYWEFVAVGSTAAPDAAKTRPWPTIRLHLPEPDVFPTDLGMVVPIQSSIVDSIPTAQMGSFAIVSTGKEGTPLTTMPTPDGGQRLLTADDFEIWVEPIPLGRSGFYAGAVESSLAERDSGGTAAVLDNVTSASESIRSRTTDGLFVLPLRSDPSRQGWFQFVDSARLTQKVGFGFRFFVRPVIHRADAGNNVGKAIGLVVPLCAYLARELPPVVQVQPDPPNWKQPPRLRPIQQLELIPKASVAQVRQATAEWVPLTLSERGLDAQIARNRPQDTRRQLGFEWLLRDALQGGVEILIRDQDDSALQSRLMCETIADADYRSRVPDFRNGSIWQLTRRERSARITWDDAATVYEPPPSGYLNPVTQFLLIDPGNPLLAELNRRKLELDQALGVPPSNWIDVFIAAKNWSTAVYDFQKSPINLNDQSVRDSIDLIKSLLRYLFTGRVDSTIGNAATSNPTTKLTAAEQKRIDDETLSTLRDIEDADPANLQLDDETEAKRLEAGRALADLDLAKRLAAMVRRRIQIAEEVFDSSAELPPTPSGAETILSDPLWLPRGERFEQLRQRYIQLSGSLAGPLPRSSQLLSMFGDASAAGKVLVLVNQELKTLVEYQGAADDEQRRQRAAAIVPRAAGLTLVFNRLQQASSSHQVSIIRRPHHQVAVAAVAGAESVAQPIMLEKLLAEQTTDATSSFTGGTPFKEAITYYNVLERMGFALDIAATNSVGDLLTQSELLALVRGAEFDGLFSHAQQTVEPGKFDDHIVQFVVGREPDSEFRGVIPDPEAGSAEYAYVGHSFLRLVVIPLEFFKLLTSELHDRPTDAQAVKDRKSENRDAVRKWFDLRKVDLGADENRWVEMIERLGRTASYVANQHSLDQAQTVRLEIRDRRWVSIPAVSGVSHIDWPVPDTRGHRFEAVARYVSRYEPVIRWALGNYLPIDWPEEQSQTPERLAVRRLVTEDLEHTSFVPDVPENLPVSLYPHPELIRASYQLPSAGARSVLNMISAVRTGYQGVSTVFRYALRDHDSDKKWDLILGAAKVREPSQTTLIPDPPVVIKPAPQNVLSDVHLLRHERLLTLRDLPYFYEYRIHVRSHYEADYLSPVAALAPEGEHVARREPKILALRPSAMGPSVPTDDSAATITIEIRLTRTGDLLTRAEWGASPPLEPHSFVVPTTTGGTRTVSLSADQLPEPAIGYHIYYRATAEDNADSYHAFIAELLMPWHPAYKPPPSNELRPWLHLTDSRAKLINPADEWPTIILGQSEHGDDTKLDQPAYIVTCQFQITRAPGETELAFAEIDRRRLQISRAGKLSEPIPQEPEHAH